jgi:hypothetical protein
MIDFECFEAQTISSTITQGLRWRSRAGSLEKSEDIHSCCQNGPAGDITTQNLIQPMDYKDPVCPTAVPRSLPTSSSATIQIFTSIYITILEHLRASINQPKCPPPPRTPLRSPRPPTPPWEPTGTLTVSSCKVTGCIFALPTGSANNHQ